MIAAPTAPGYTDCARRHHERAARQLRDVLAS
ncbi:hypothetical protein M2271_000383 [Streptomyces sp. LBL]|nr:hypothetical protein [Streptomyces sp. LBL]